LTGDEQNNLCGEVFIIRQIMSGKRKHEEVEGVHSSRQAQVYDSVSSQNPAKKPRRKGPHVPQKQRHDSSVNTIKKRIRDVTRRLQRSQNLPANVRVDDERALAAYNHDLASAEEEKIRQKMIRKYHMVRFFGA
jgi:4-hydroxy-3-methylbut-2-enyl diphosphate reductase IspH